MNEQLKAMDKWLKSLACTTLIGISKTDLTKVTISCVKIQFNKIKIMLCSLNIYFKFS